MNGRAVARGWPVIAAALVLCAGGASADPAATDTLAARRWRTHVNAAAGGYGAAFDSLRFGERETAACLQCHGAGTLLLRDPTTGAVRDYSVSAPAWGRSAHRQIACTQCHADIRAYPHRFEGERPRIGCDADCHAKDERGRAVRHDHAMAEQRASVHRGGLDGTDPRSPSCVGCHGGGDPHRVEPVGKGFSPLARLDRCAPCHDDADAMRASDVEPGAVRGYRESFHYAALRHGATKGAVCEDCHDAHEVRAADDSTARTAPARLAATCGQEGCHPGASSAFARSGADHVPQQVAERPVLAAVERSFRAFGFGLLGLLAAGAVMDAQWRLRRRGRSASVDSGLVERLPVGQRLVHGALMLSFTVLIATGAPIRFADAGWAADWTWLLGGPEALRVLHRAAAVLLLATALVHAIAALRALAAHGFSPARAWSLWPTKADVAEASQTIAHQLGRRADAPRFGRRTWRGKLHYATVALGVCAMSASGLALAFPEAIGGVLPPATLGLLRMLHGDEAVVALGITIVWHLYHVHLAPWPHQRFLTWFDGRVTRAYWRAEHPREAAAVEAAGGGGAAVRPGPRP